MYRVEAGLDVVMLDFEHEITPQTWPFERADGVPGGDRVGLDNPR